MNEETRNFLSKIHNEAPEGFKSDCFVHVVDHRPQSHFEVGNTIYHYSRKKKPLANRLILFFSDDNNTRSGAKT